jgi:iron complex outermembrane receptor protein
MKPRRTNVRNLAGFISGFALFVNMADAQTVNPASAGSGDELAEVVVTATHRTENLQNVTIAITDVSEKQIEDRHIQDMQDLSGSIPNVVIADAPGNQNGANPIIRGISTSIRNAGTDAGAIFYVDGVYTGRPETFNQVLDDVASVDVLQGPQGTLFGKNAIAGAFVANTHDPEQSTYGRVTLDQGNYAYTYGTLMFNTPVVPDVLAARFNFYYDKRDGYLRNLYDGEELGNNNYYGGRTKLKFTPSDDFDATLAVDYRRNQNHHTPTIGEILSGVDPTNPAHPIIAPGPLTTDDSGPSFLGELSDYGYALTSNYRPGGDYQITSISALRRSSDTFLDSQDASPYDSIDTHWFDSSRNITQELRLRSPEAERFKYVVGLFYFDQDLISTHEGILGPYFTPYPFLHNVDIVPHAVIQTHSYAAFADGSYELFSGLFAEAGVRVTREIKHIAFSVDSPPGGQALFFNIPEEWDTKQQTDASPEGGLRYAISTNESVYFKVSRGYKSGGWNADYISGSGVAPTIQQLGFQPESVTNYELGLKGDFLDHRIRVNSAVYYEDYENLQVIQWRGFAGGDVTGNAAAAKIKGVEGDITALLFAGLEAGASMGFNNAKYTEYPGVDGPNTDGAGNRLPGPKLTGDVHLNYRLGTSVGTFNAFGQVTYIGDQFEDPENTPSLRIPSYTLVNSSLDYSTNPEKWSVQLWSRNMLNKTYLLAQQADTLAVLLGGGSQIDATYGMPRTFGIKGTVNF